MRRAIILPALLLMGSTLAAQDPYRTALDTWHADRVARLKAEDGWLSLIGLDWLEPGENTLGSAPGSKVLLPEGTAPAQAGLLILEGKTVKLRPLPESGLLVNGKPAEEMTLKADADGKADVIQAGRVRFHLIRRGDRLGVRMKDPEAPARKAFQGVPRYAVDPRWRIEADYLPYPKPQIRDIPTVLGTSTPMTAPGLLRFRVGGRKVMLEPMVEEGAKPQLFLIFSDATSAKGTYAAGRFLYADMPKKGKVILDFNRAINPPCAFSIFATCPLPPKQNQVEIEILAGEKDPGLH